MPFRIFLILLFCLSANALLSQSQSLRQFTVHDGLVQQQVLNIFEDSRGYLWIGTKIGVSKFNGESFENFKTTDGLLDDYNKQILEDSKGNIWIGSSNGLTKFDGKTFTQFSIEGFGGIDRMDINNKDEILLRRRSSLYPNLFLFDGQKFNPIGHPKLDGNLKGWGVAFDKTNNHFVFAYKGRGICTIEGDSIIELLHLPNIQSLSRNNQTQKIHVVEFEKGLRKVSIFENDSLQSFITQSQEGTPLEVNFNSLSENYYFVSLGKLWHINPKTQELIIVQKTPFSLPKAVYKSSSGKIWIGTDEGLFAYDGAKGFMHFESKPFQYIWSVTEDKKGKYWLSSYNSGLKVLDGMEVKDVTHHNPLFPQKKGHFYYGSLKDKNDNLLFPSQNHILKYDGTNFSLLKSSGLSDDINLQLFEDKETGLLFAGVGGGVNVFKDYELIQKIDTSSGIHSTRYIVSIAKDKNENYWFGSYVGLSKFNSKTQKITNYTHKNKKLPSKGVISMALDSIGNLWLGGQSGLMIYDYQKDSIKLVAPELNKTTSVVFAPNSELLMFGQTDGLYFIDLEVFHKNGAIKYKYFNHKNGFLGIAPEQNGAFKDSKGKVWVASSLSVDVFDPNNLDLSSKPSKAAIVKLNDERIPFGDEQIDLPKGENALKFKFEGIGSDGTFKTQYSYFLEDVDEKWSSWTTDDFAFYDNLGSGVYNFRLRSRLGSTIKETVLEDSLKVKINLNAWKEPDFYKATLIILIGSFFLFVLAMSERTRRLAVAEKSKKIQFLNKEISHRVKNNLSLVASMVDMQKRRVEAEPAKKALSDTSMRIQAMSSLYRGLYQSEETKVNMKEYLEELIENLRNFFMQENEKVQLRLQVWETDFLESEKAMLVGLIINETVTNAVKYAFEGIENPTIEVRYLSESKEANLTVKDNGVGVKNNLEFQNSESFGMTLINNFVNQLKGNLTIENRKGLSLKITFPKK